MSISYHRISTVEYGLYNYEYIYIGCESVRSNDTGRSQAVRHARALGVPQRQGLRGGAGQGVRSIHQQQRGDQEVPVVI